MVQISPPREPRYFNFISKDDDEVPVFGSKRSHNGDLQDPDMLYDQALKRSIHDLMDSAIVERLRHIAIVVGTSSNNTVSTTISASWYASIWGCSWHGHLMYPRYILDSFYLLFFNSIRTIRSFYLVVWCTIATTVFHCCACFSVGRDIVVELEFLG